MSPVHGRRVAEHLDEIRALRPAILYTDLDGTLFGRGGSLFAGADQVSTRAAEALASLHRAEIPVVPVSGRTEEQVHEAGRVIGASGFIAELGGIIHTGTEIIRRYGAYDGVGTPHEAMARTGAAGFVLERFAGRLEPHAPWAFRGRECTMLLRGDVDVAEARVALEEAGYGWLDLVDNGRISHPGPTEVVHAYHLAPRGVTKADAVAEDLRRRGIEPARAVAVGDSPSDVALSAELSAVMLVANAIGPDILPANVFVTVGERGDGFAEGIDALLGS